MVGVGVGSGIGCRVPDTDRVVEIPYPCHYIGRGGCW